MTDSDNFIKRAGQIMDAAMKLKSQMKARGLIRARAKCPFCAAGFLHGRLAGPRSHLHMYCDGKGCSVGMME